jgi:hypothetical protein
MENKLFIIIILLCSFTWQSCEDEVEPKPLDCADNPVELTIASVQDANCSMQNGRIEVAASGGSGKYQFRLGSGNLQATGIFLSVGAGTYQITAVDENNCSGTLEASVKNLDGLDISLEKTDAGCGTSNGTLTVTAVDGTQPYQFKLNAGAFSGTNTFSNLPKGEHDLIVKDASGCEIAQTVKITTGIGYAASISSIIQGNCAISGCHNGSQPPDFRVFKNIHDNAGQVKALTGNGTMPQGRTLTQEQINMIACWVDDGALEN